MVKAIFFDIDGTLVKMNQKKISEPVKKALDQLREKGVKLFVATGRPPMMVTHEFLDYDFDGYIAMNGQYCMVNDEVIYETYFNPDSLMKMLAYARSQNIICDIHESNYLYCNFKDPAFDEFTEIFGAMDEGHPVDDIHRIYTHKTYQVSPRVKNERALELLEYLPEGRAVFWNPYFIDIIHKDSGKEIGIQKMMKYFNLENEPFACIGDGQNDQGMIEFATIGIAMGNASDDVKASADYVCKDVAEDGLIDAFQYLKLM